MITVGLGDLDRIKPLLKLRAEEAQARRRFLYLSDQRRARWPFCRLQGQGEFHRRDAVPNFRLQFGQIPPTLLVPNLRPLMFDDPIENHFIPSLVARESYLAGNKFIL